MSESIIDFLKQKELRISGYEVEKAGKCEVCGKLTNYVDLDFQCYICSKECEEKLMNEYFKSLQSFTIKKSFDKI